MSYAGFWKRAASYLIDFIIFSILAMAVAFIIGFMLAANDPYIDDLTLEFFGGLVGALSTWIYYAAFESSTKQATPGKMALGIIVTDLEGNRISFGRASGRFFSKLISSLIIGIGFIMVAFTEKKQGLHDKMCECLIIDK
tara:strand:- start:551 stop:970 length:420 start_codon:yes stop_codon:yes gene_type:complete